MAISLARSRNIIRRLKSNIGFVGVASDSSWTSSSTHHPQRHISSLTAPIFINYRSPRAAFSNSVAHFSAGRFESSEAENQLDSFRDVDGGRVLDFPGGVVTLTSEMRFIPESTEKRTHCYRILDDNGNPVIGDNFIQRQGRISFYVTTIGEEAINVASAAALNADDLVFPQYREPGVLLWRGFTLVEFANQCFGNKDDLGKGRQMPVHYGSNKHNYFTISSTIATQIPHAVGAAYSLKMDGKDACAVTYFGDGGTSEGDFHSALNFAAVMEVPVIFICRNNGWAISTPVSDQFRSDGVVVKGQAYGVRSIRVDGNDALAMYRAVLAAREIAVNEHKPILIEALTYRVGHHSTSDDSTKYRSANEIEWWRMSRNPATRFRKWLESNGWWSEEAELMLRSSVRKQLLHAIQAAEKMEKASIAELFTDVYDIPPFNLHEQETLLRESINRHPQDYPLNVPV
ncbi:2-oxoisovalerate dehydrogenase subunit alpha 2, mitochondrial isoform X2 [Malania oleifera]|uniref:2-oxoisovalerate dehydrogenase subunit alpha 2, mitochondrial isoform X2 n=1 Tax=Malania oleifera TaxID=397392 RepID=UPI0025AE6347|nr:2-oxoisovalerate dehydrogenase subunit alpha 2, mitochondrial isoform X2 [Malania oleifera]